MGDIKKAALEQYVKYLSFRSEITSAYSFELEQNIIAFREKATMLILQFLCICPPQERFKFQEFPNLILQSSSMEFFEPIKASEAFTNLENYFALLCIMPWKQEFHQIKKYGGFYQTKIESHLKNADSIFELIGYKEVSAGLLVLSHSTKLDVLQCVSFECFVASNECRIIENIWNRVLDRGLTVTNVVLIRQQTRGSYEEIVRLIDSKYGKSLSKISKENVVDSRKGAEEKRSVLQSPTSTDMYRNKLENYIEKAKKLSDFEDFPFIDEGGVKENEYTPINLDEQILASLQLVEAKDVSPTVNNKSTVPSLKPSQEWSFVREGLERNYGKQYFDGPRKDILEQQANVTPHAIKESKYVKVYAQSPDPGYVNSDAAKQLRKTEELKALPYGMNIQPMLSESKDSDYGTSSSAFFPPTLEDPHSQSMRMRGVPAIRQVTDTVLTKGPGPYYQAEGNRHAKTEPILRRQPVEQNVQVPHQSYSQHPQTSGYGNITNIANENRDNIKKYQKRVSAPLTSTNKMDPTQILPVVTSAPSLSGAKSFSQLQSRNTVDSIHSHGAKTVHNVQQNIPVQADVVLEHTRVNPQWSCQYCTFFNNPHSDVCEMCSKSRDPTMEVDSPPCAGHTSRICHQCTLENEKDSVNCHACGQMLNGTQTVV